MGKSEDIPEPTQNETLSVPHQEKPKPEDFNLPSNPKVWKELVDKLMALGLKRKEANTSLEKRKNSTTLHSRNSPSTGRPRPGREDQSREIIASMTTKIKIVRWYLC